MGRRGWTSAKSASSKFAAILKLDVTSFPVTALHTPFNSIA